MTFLPSLPDDPAGSGSSDPPPANLPEATPALRPLETVAGRYTVVRVLATSAARTVYEAVDPDENCVFLLEMNAPLHLDPPADPDETQSLPVAGESLTLSVRACATVGDRTVAAFISPKGHLACVKGHYGWDPERLSLVSAVVESLRRARDHQVFIPHCSWETLFVTPTLDVLWLSPESDDTRYGQDGPAVRAPGTATGPLEAYYAACLQALLPPLVLHNFAGVPVPEDGLRPRDKSLPEEVPWNPKLLSSPECRHLLSEIISGRIGSLDEVRHALEPFGATRVAHLDSNWRTHRGRVRELNEDGLLVLEQCGVVGQRPHRTVLYAVADGMGGHEAGEVASEITLRALATELLTHLNLTSADGFGRRIQDHAFLLETAAHAIDRTNETLRDYTLDVHADARKKPGSTLVFALCSGPVATIGHVGDSRAYKIRADGSLERMTRDHSPVQRMVDLGRLTPEEAFSHPYRHQIFSNIGIAPQQLTTDLDTRYLCEDEGILLCSDGLSDMLRDAEIESICHAQGRDPRRLTQALVEAACAAGGVDNITVIAVFRSSAPMRMEPRAAGITPDEIEEAQA